MELRGFAELPADTFAEGPLLVNESDGSLMPEPRYQGQPVQGFSGVQFADKVPTGFFLTMDLAQAIAKTTSCAHRLDPSFKGQMQTVASTLLTLSNFLTLIKKFHSRSKTKILQIVCSGFDLDESFVTPRMAPFG